MEILKKNVFWIVCGAVAALGITLSVLGLNAMGAVTTEMEAASDLQRKIQSAAAKPVNKALIDAETGRVAEIRKQFEDVTSEARKRNARAPLGVKEEAWQAYLTEATQKPVNPNPEGENKPPSIPDCVFPEAKGQRALVFQDAYKAELARLRDLLKADGPPTQADINYHRTRIKETLKPTGKDVVAPKPPGTDPTPGSPDTGGATPEKTDVKPPSSGLISKEECEVSAECCAALDKAHKILCYIGEESLQVVARVLTGSLTDLKADLLWDAQRSFWVQQDVVEALAKVNDRAAEEIRKTGREAWVGVLPIKDVISIRVSDYIHEKSEGVAPAKPGDDKPAKPPGTSGESFTGLVSSPMYDTLQFTVKLIVDERRVPEVINEICKDRFHTPIRIAYAAVPPNLKMSGKIYGEDPVVDLVADFESYYFTEVYRPLMPKGVLGEPAKPAGGGG